MNFIREMTQSFAKILIRFRLPSDGLGESHGIRLIFVPIRMLGRHSQKWVCRGRKRCRFRRRMAAEIGTEFSAEFGVNFGESVISNVTYL